MSNLRDPRPYETVADLVRERIRLERICAIHAELSACHLDPHVEALLDEMGVLDDANWRDGEDYVLRIAGKVCLENGQPALWLAIFTAARDGSVVEPGDEMRFLDRNHGLA